MPAKSEPIPGSEAKVLPGWRRLLAKSLRDQAEQLKSDEFLSIAQTAALLGVREATVRRRIREGKLLALRHPAGGEHRVPVWAIRIGASDTKALTDLDGDNSWDLYQFMESPHGAMRAMRPFDLLVAPDGLPPIMLATRDALADSLTARGGTLRGLVLRALTEHVSREA